jgi:site-specific DNA recombinase
MNNLNYSDLKLVNYNRKSSESEEKQMLSIDSQIDEINKLAKYYGVSIIDTLKESKSGKMAYKRPIFSQMIKDIQKGKYNAIICWKLDRLARNMIEGGILMDMLQRGTIRCIITPNKIYDSSENTLMLSVEFGSANQFVRDLSVNVKRGQAKKASLGFPHGVATLGFINDKTEEKGNRKWLVDKVRLNKISLLLRKFLDEGYTGGKLYDYAVNELGLTTVNRKKTGGLPIVRSRIYEILKDPIYAGFFFYGGDRYELHPSLPRIISESEHNKILRMLGDNSFTKVQNHKTTFSGLIKSDSGHVLAQDVKYQVICDCKRKFSCVKSNVCPDCGIAVPDMKKPVFLQYCYHYDSRKKKSGQKYRYVDEKKVTHELNSFVSASLCLSPDIVQWSKANLYQLNDKEIADNLSKEENITSDKLKYEEERAGARSQLRRGIITEDEYKMDLADIERKYRHVSGKKSAEEVNWMNKLNEIMDFTVSINEVLEKGSYDQKRKVLIALGANLIWDEENLCFTWSKPIEALIKGINGIRVNFPEFEPKLNFDLQGLNEKTSLKRDVFSIMLRE